MKDVGNPVGGYLMKKDIYIIKNNINGKVYIGQSVDAKARFSKHLSDAKYNRDNQLIHKAINKYGKDNFYYEVLESQIENYNEREQYWIEYYNSLVPNGYNIAIGGQGIGNGIQHPASKIKNEEVLQEIYQELKENKISLTKLAEKYNCCFWTIYSINKGEAYYNSSLTYPLRPSTRYSEELIKQLYYSLKYELDKSLQEIAKEYNIDYSQLSEINNGKLHARPWATYPLRKSKEIKIQEILSNIINDLENSSLSQKEIAKKYNVCQNTVSNINLGFAWRDEKRSYPIRNNKNGKYNHTCISPDLLNSIYEDLKNTSLSMKKIADKYEIPAATIKGINNGSIKKYRNDYYKYPIRSK